MDIWECQWICRSVSGCVGTSVGIEENQWICGNVSRYVRMSVDM